MHPRPPRAVRLRLPQHLAGDRRDLALPEQEEPQELRERIALRPLEVDVRLLPGAVPDGEQQRGQRVGDAGALQRQHPVAVVQHLAVHGEHGLELRGVLDRHLDEDQVVLGRDVVVRPDLALLLLVLGEVAAVGLVGDQAQRPMGVVAHEALGGLVEDDVGDPEFEGALEPGEQGDEHDGGDEAGADLHAVGAFGDVEGRGVEEDGRDDREADGPAGLAGGPGGDGDGDRGGADQHEYAGGVGAALGVHAGVEEPGDQEGDQGEHDDHRPDRLRPVRRHAVAGEVAGQQVEHARHGGGTGEPEDRDGGQVVDAAEGVAEVLVGQVGERASVGLAALLEGFLRDQQGGDEAGGDQEHAHDQRGGGEQLAGAADPAGRLLLGVVRVALDVRHDGDAGLEAGEAEGEFGEGHQGDADHGDDVAVLGGERVRPVGHDSRGAEDVVEAGDDDDHVEREVDGNQDDGQPDRLAEALEEDAAEQGDQHQGDDHLLAGQGAVQVRVLDQVGGGVGGRQGDGDHEVGGREAEQREDEQLALPERQQAFQHRDRALAVRALPGHPAVDRQGAAEGDDDEDDGRHRGEQTGREGGDAGLVAEGGEVVEAGQAHHPPPGAGLFGGGLGVRAGVLLDPVGQALQQPGAEALPASEGAARSRGSHPAPLCPTCPKPSPESRPPNGPPTSRGPPARRRHGDETATTRYATGPLTSGNASAVSPHRISARSPDRTSGGPTHVREPRNRCGSGAHGRAPRRGRSAERLSSGKALSGRCGAGGCCRPRTPRRRPSPHRRSSG